MTQVRIIAEGGVNHDGREDLAFELIDAAYNAGADTIKFQIFNSKELVTPDAMQAEYQRRNTKKRESQLKMLSHLELSHRTYHKLMDYCNDLGIEFLSTAFDSKSLNFLVQKLKLKTLKIASGEITNAPFILEHARSQCDLIMSTGMSTLAEIKNALGVIAFGLTTNKETDPSIGAFQSAFYSQSGQQALEAKVTLLHCTSEYPAPTDDINLRAITALSSEFNLDTGFSDHSDSITIPVAAVALGAVIVEKHLTLDRGMQGPDHKASIEPNEFKKMVSNIRKIEVALGDGIKKPRASELKNQSVSRKSIFAVSIIKKGEQFTEKNIGIKRPDRGADPFNYWELIGNYSSKNYNPGEPIYE